MFQESHHDTYKTILLENVPFGVCENQLFNIPSTAVFLIVCHKALKIKHSCARVRGSI